MPSSEPRRMVIGNIDDGEDLVAQFNPTEVEIALEAFFGKTKIPGQSFEEQQYSNTGNPRVSFTLAFDGLSQRTPRGLVVVESFLMALAYPVQTPSSVSTGAPPEVLLFWPSWLSLITTMPKITQTTRRWSIQGEPTYQTYKIELEGKMTRRLGREEIRRAAFRRAS